MSRVILLRHGQSLFNAGYSSEFDSDLSERGYYQIQDGALHVKELMNLDWIGEIDQIYTMFVSPFLRTLKTALPIHRLFNVKTFVDTRIGETPEDVNFFKGKVLPSRYIDFPTYNWKLSDFPIEMDKITMEQYHANLEDFAKRLPDYSIVVSHMTTIKDLTALLVGAKKTDFATKEVGNCSVTMVEDGELVFMGKR